MDTQARKDKNMNVPTESQIVRAILDGLAYKGVMAWRNNVAPIPVRRGKAIVGMRRCDPHIKGMSDVLAVMDGKIIGIEVKTEKGKLNEDQLAWAARFTKAGGRYLVARSWDDIEKALGL